MVLDNYDHFSNLCFTGMPPNLAKFNIGAPSLSLSCQMTQLSKSYSKNLGWSSRAQESMLLRDLILNENLNVYFIYILYWFFTLFLSNS